MPYSVNRAATPYFSHIGRAMTPVFILDDFLLGLEDNLLQNLETLQFDEATTYYPGIRAKLPEGYIVSVAKAVMPLLFKIYAIPAHYKVEFFDSFYSLVTYSPSELSLEQRVPHFDGTDTYRLALLHYLNPGPHGGTAFYRHNPTGIERVNESQVNTYLRSVSHYFNQPQAQQSGYMNNANTQFYKVGEIPYVQNRMAVYPGNFLHSGIINPETDIDANPTTGRLTANIFVNFKPA